MTQLYSPSYEACSDDTLGAPKKEEALIYPVLLGKDPPKVPVPNVLMVPIFTHSTQKLYQKRQITETKTQTENTPLTLTPAEAIIKSLRLLNKEMAVDWVIVLQNLPVFH